ncbi:hypothetical protein PBI_INDLOVU_50 [Mycobacterium phage Indlovu]|nr:hypothetical protein PBI_INDLOVU_50 [Mycobacterium phage Indlovu]
MKLLIAESDDDRRALLALAGLSPPVNLAPPDLTGIKLPTDVVFGVPAPEVDPTITTTRRRPHAEAVNLDADPDPDADDAEAAVRVAEPSGGPFGSNHTNGHPIASEAHSQPAGIKCPAGVDELGERLFDAYCFLFDRYHPDRGVHYRAYARASDLKPSTASSRLHRLVERGLATDPGKNGIFRAVVVSE